MLSVCAPTLAPAQSALQRGYDCNLSGAKPQQTILNTTNAGSGNFGMLFELAVHDAVFAHDVGFVATMSATLDTFDSSDLDLRGSEPLLIPRNSLAMV